MWMTPKDRNNQGGGVFILVKSNIIATEYTDNIYYCELLWIKIQLRKAKQIFLSCFYMPHRDKDILNEFEKSLFDVNPQGTRNIFICGDFNCPDVNWEHGFSHDQAPNKDVQDKLINISVDNSLTQLQEEPTRLNNILDLTFVSNPSLIRTQSTIPGISDHCATITDSYIKPSFIIQRKRKVYNFDKADWPSLHSFCENLSISLVSRSNMNFSIFEL